MTTGSGQFSGQRARKPHLVRGTGGLQGEVADLRQDIEDDLSANAAIAVEEYTDPAAADDDAIRLAAATVASARTLSGSDLDGAVGEAEMTPPRNITITTAGVTPGDAPANATIKGKVRDPNGVLVDQEETIAVGQTATTVVGASAFSTVESIDEEAADGTDATLAYGFGDVLGLAKPLVTRAGAAGVLKEIEAGSTVTTGTFVDAATEPPNGTYAPSTVPDGSNDYALYYEYDASQND